MSNNNEEKQEVFNWDVNIDKAANELFSRQTINIESTRDRYLADEILSGRCPFGMLDNNQPGVLGCCSLGVPGCACADEYMLNPHLTHLLNEMNENTPSEPNNDVSNSHVDLPGYREGVTLYTPAPMQAKLSEPLYTCRIGWAYDTSRTTSKRTGLPLKKKPSYRYEKTISGNEAWQLGRYDEDSNIPLENFLLFSPKRTRDLVVFIPTELWSQYPNSQSWTKPVVDNDELLSTPEILGFIKNHQLLGDAEVDVNAKQPIDAINNPHVGNSRVGNTGWWQRFLDWFGS